MFPPISPNKLGEPDTGGLGMPKEAPPALPSWSQLALMASPTVSKFTSYDQGETTCNIFRSYRAYLSYLEANGLFFTMPGDEKALLQDLGNCLSEAEKLSGHTQSKDLKQGIDQQLKKGVAYFHTGWLSPELGKGHGIVCKITRDATHTRVFFLNLGDGCQAHSNGSVITTRYKICYSYHPVEITNDEWNKRSELFLQRLLRFNFERPEKDHPVRGEEVYDLLHLLGPLNTNFVATHASKLIDDAQFLGSCSEEIAKNLFTDHLVMNKGFTIDQAQRFLLNCRIAALKMAHQTYVSKPNPQHRLLLEAGAKKLETDLKPHRKKIATKELQRAVSTLKTILSATEKPVVMPPPSNPPLLCTYFVAKSPRPTLIPLSLVPYISSITYLETRLPAFKPAQFNQHLKTFLEELEKNSDNLNSPLLALYEAICSLPIPKWQEKDLWDDVPPEHLKEILNNLKKLGAMWTPDRNTLCVGKNNQLCAHFTLYAIVDKLVRKCVGNRLMGFATPLPSLCAHENFAAFTNISEVDRYLALKGYFSAQKGKMIFPAGPTVDVERFLKENGTQGANHLQFLAQFRNKAPTTAADYMELWDSNEILPEILILYSFVIMNVQFYLPQIPFKRENGEIVLSAPRSIEINDDSYSSYIYIEQLVKKKNHSTNEMSVLEEGTDEYLQLSQNKIDLELYKELMTMMRHPQLKIGIALTWIQNHWHLLHLYPVQRVLESCFFSAVTVASQFNRNGDFIEEFRAIIEKGIKHFPIHLENLNALLFLVKLGIQFEAFVDDGKREVTLEKYRKVLQSLLALPDVDNRDILLHLLQLEMLVGNRSESALIETTTQLFRYGLQERRYGGEPKLLISEKFHLFLAHHVKQIELFLKESGNLNQLFNGVVKKLFPKPFDEATQWQKTGMLVKSPNFVFDLSIAGIRHPQWHYALSLKAGSYKWGGNFVRSWHLLVTSAFNR